MDPLTALSLAGNIIQFIDYSSKLVSKGRQIYRSADGALQENTEIEVVTTDFLKVVERLLAPKGLNINPSLASDNAIDVELQQILSHWKRITTEILVKLEKVKVTGNNRAWKSFRQALKAVSSKEDVDDIMRRLCMFRQQLEFRIMVSFA
jgi:hypothetical protein